MVGTYPSTIPNWIDVFDNGESHQVNVLPVYSTALGDHLIELNVKLTRSGDFLKDLFRVIVLEVVPPEIEDQSYTIYDDELVFYFDYRINPAKYSTSGCSHTFKVFKLVDEGSYQEV